MTGALSLTGTETVLEIGAGSGYQAAVLSLLAREVIAVEALPSLAAAARERLARLGYPNVRIVVADGSLGWPQSAPYDAILVTAAAPSVPPPFFDQLRDHGRLVIPVGGSREQELLQLVKRGAQFEKKALYHCRFVPLIGRYGWPAIASGAAAP